MFQARLAGKQSLFRRLAWLRDALSKLVWIFYADARNLGTGHLHPLVWTAARVPTRGCVVAGVIKGVVQGLYHEPVAER